MSKFVKHLYTIVPHTQNLKIKCLLIVSGYILGATGEPAWVFTGCIEYKQGPAIIEQHVIHRVLLNDLVGPEPGYLWAGNPWGRTSQVNGPPHYHLRAGNFSLPFYGWGHYRKKYDESCFPLIGFFFNINNRNQYSKLVL